MKRLIVEIDHNRCDGCGACIPNCAEGALKIVNGKAVLASDRYCDGLGACLGLCPRDAIRIVEREAEEFDPRTVQRPPDHAHACPGSKISVFQEPNQKKNTEQENSQLSHWPIQLHLVPINAPFLQKADLLLAASCVPFAYAEFHRNILAGRSLIIACPKLDRTEPYLEKLTAILLSNDIKSLTVAVMEVPCCQGLVGLARKALKNSGKRMPITVEVISTKGERR
jgi:NAD-dependent dihydropyrimidine dehydrogenase PreA subunit